MLLGVIAQSLPDIDIIASVWLKPAENLMAHRGFTHSIFFAILITGILALLARRWYLKRIALKTWVLLWGINIFTHLFIDAFNAYGTGWFEPFSHERISFHTLFVADPLFTIWPLVAFIALILLANNHKRRKIWWRAGIGLSCLYLIYAIINKINVDTDVKHSLAQQSVQYQKYLVTPTPLNNWLWYIVVGDSTGFYIGYRSVFDTKEKIDLEYFPRRDSLLNAIHDHENLQHLRRFSQGYYTVEKWSDTLVFNDLRFGQIVGWYNPREKFVFHYFLQHPSENELVVQRGRFAKWNEETVHSLLKRIKGN